MLKDISIDELQPGMYVSRVLEQTGSMRVRSGGLVKSEAIIEQLRAKGIVRIEIDYARSKLTSKQHKALPPATGAAFLKASALYTKAVSLQKNLLEQLKNGATRDLNSADELARHIIDNVFENQNAMACLAMIKNADEYLLEHSINCSILMAIFATHLSFNRATVDELCTGALLMDVGMAQIPELIRLKQGSLTTDEWQVIQSHVPKGLALVDGFAGIAKDVRQIIAQHHERVDGSGYPEQLEGNSISLFARMAAIVDSYDAMISNRSHQRAVAPAVALKRLSTQTGLDQQLVRQFVRCIGVHPVGSLVKLQSGRLAIVAQANQEDMLKPVVMTFYSINSDSYSEIKRLDLTKTNDDIVASVRPDDFGINLPRFFRDVFIHQMPDA
ncbi:HD-GYP domain-containing protein [Salinimonas sediminis]|uniref:HD-GYP domain-containing protein n=1 Tax=Salinimonas sediminis TaxID=2303538 RepID=A0A346NJ95_9ALTE|nr:HD-GYP domain-containing protein [Salinimonas sediminis]AXR05602.1 HD-GYP domain-containing protein [Salinimonas sediminis]